MSFNDEDAATLIGCSRGRLGCQLRSTRTGVTYGKVPSLTLPDAKLAFAFTMRSAPAVEAEAADRDATSAMSAVFEVKSMAALKDRLHLLRSIPCWMPRFIRHALSSSENNVRRKGTFRRATINRKLTMAS